MTRTAPLLALLVAGLAVAQSPKPPSELAKPLELFKAGKFDTCLEELRKATQANPTLRPPRLILAEWFAQAKRPNDARLNLERAIVEDPNHPEGYLMNANVAFGEGRVTDALLNLRHAQALAADVRWTAAEKKRFLLETRLGLATCFESRGDAAGVREALEGVLTDDPKNGAVRGRLATALFSQDKPDEAFAELTKAHADDPAVDLPELRMAALWTAKANDTPKLADARPHREQAESWLKKAIAAHPKSAKPLRAYANWLMDDGRADAAAPYVEAAAKLEPTARDTLAVRGVLARHKKDFATAATVFESLYKDAPNDAFAVGNLAIVLAESGDVEKQKRAVYLAISLVRQNPNSPDAVAILGWCKLKAGRVDEAEEHFLSVLKAGNTMSLDALYFAGKLLSDRKKYQEAHNVLKAALDARGPFVYRPEAAALLAEVTKLVPVKKDDPKKDDPKKDDPKKK